jgi:hypothetical protein
MQAREQTTRRQDERDGTSGGYNQGRGPQLATSISSGSTPGLKWSKSYLYPKAALNTITLATTAFGVQECSKYIKVPVAHRANAI